MVASTKKKLAAKTTLATKKTSAAKRTTVRTKAKKATATMSGAEKTVDDKHKPTDSLEIKGANPTKKQCQTIKLSQQSIKPYTGELANPSPNNDDVQQEVHGTNTSTNEPAAVK